VVGATGVIALRSETVLGGDMHFYSKGFYANSERFMSGRAPMAGFPLIAFARECVIGPALRRRKSPAGDWTSWASAETINRRASGCSKSDDPWESSRSSHAQGTPELRVKALRHDLDEWIPDWPAHNFPAGE
jgi:hypothetical protein